MVRIAARPCQRCTHLLYSIRSDIAFLIRLCSLQHSQPSLNLRREIQPRPALQNFPTLRPSSTRRLRHLFASSLSSSRLPAQPTVVRRNRCPCWRENCEITSANLSSTEIVRGRVSLHGFWRTYSEGARLCSRDSPAAVPRWRSHFLQLHLHDARIDVGISGQHSSDGSSHFFTRGRF